MIGEPSTTEELVRLYVAAKRVVIDHGFVDEIAWQAVAGQGEPSPTTFVREAAWVVLSAGMREAVVRGVFDLFAEAMHGFDPIPLSHDRLGARAAALAKFRHERKVDAILDIAEVTAGLTLRELHTALNNNAEQFLRSLPYIGPATWRHLAKNLGIPIAKPDRHLVRMVRATARQSVDALCQEIAEWLGEPIGVVDLVLWRWSVLHARECRQTCDATLHRPAS